MIPKIKQLGYMAPKRTHRTAVLHLYGPPGTGKTSTIYETLITLQKYHPQLDTYEKLGGFEKYWEGYDNQPIVVIDDPVLP